MRVFAWNPKQPALSSLDRKGGKNKPSNKLRIKDVKDERKEITFRVLGVRKFNANGIKTGVRLQVDLVV